VGSTLTLVHDRMQVRQLSTGMTAPFVALAHQLDDLSSGEQYRRVHDIAARELHRAPPFPAAVLRLYSGRACSRLGRVGEALRNLRVARRYFESCEATGLAIESLDEEATALHLQEDPRALTVAEEALARCRMHRDKVSAGTRSRVLAHLGRIRVAHHAWSSGVALLQAALDTLGNVRHLTEITPVYNDMAMGWTGVGDVRMGVSYGRKALKAASGLASETAVAQAENNLGVALAGAGHRGEGEQLLRAALRRCERLGLELGRSHVMVGLADLRALQDDLDQAWRYAQSAGALSERLGEQLTFAAALECQGRLADRAQRRCAADHYFRAAIEVLSSSGCTYRQVACHSRYAQLLERRREHARASRHYRQAVLLFRDCGP
jgi:tetratricopeptide (TPR) repeat protein